MCGIADDQSAGIIKSLGKHSQLEDIRCAVIIWVEKDALHWQTQAERKGGSTMPVVKTYHGFVEH